MNKKTTENGIEIYKQNERMRVAGCNLAEAAIRVIRDYDGIHRLSLAISEWFKIIADENNRDKLNKK